MNKRIETYIILGAYFAMGLLLGYFMGKSSIEECLATKKMTENLKIETSFSGGRKIFRTEKINLD